MTQINPAPKPTNNHLLDELTEWILKEPSYTETEMQDKIRYYIRQIIGEDEEIIFSDGYDGGKNATGAMLKDARNNLRAEQRKALGDS